MENALHQLMRLGHLEIHIGLSNPNIYVRILAHCYCVAIVSLSSLKLDIEQDETRKPLLITQETD